MLTAEEIKNCPVRYKIIRTRYGSPNVPFLKLIATYIKPLPNGAIEEVERLIIAGDDLQDLMSHLFDMNNIILNEAIYGENP
jgi:hypothetical protein